MFWSIISESDILFDEKNIKASNQVRSSNPYDYVCKGYFIDGACAFGGKNFVDFNSDFSSDRTSNNFHTPNF